PCSRKVNHVSWFVDRVKRLSVVESTHTFMNTPPVNSSDSRPKCSLSPWAWFGAQIGATLWLVRAAWMLGPHAPRETLLPVLICFAVPNFVGLALWFRRRQVGEWAAFRSMLIAMAVCTFVAMS